MRQYAMIPLAIFTLLVALIVPLIVSSISKSHQVKPHVSHSLDTTFIPTSQSNILEIKVRQLEKRMIQIQDVSSCDAPEDKVCDNLKKQYNRLLVEADLTLQKEADLRLIYQSKWNTTCMSWKNESQRLFNVTTNKNYELNNNSIKIQQMVSSIFLLKSKINDIEPCKCQKCIDKECQKCSPNICPQPLPCPNCAENCAPCEICAECPHCLDQDYNQLHDQYTTLYRKFQKCQDEVKKQKQNSENPSNCNQNQNDEVKSYLKKGLGSLSKSFQSGQFGSQQLKDSVKELDYKLSTSQTIEQSLAIVSKIINGLAKQLQDIAKQQNDKCGKCADITHCDDKSSKLVNECMDLFKKAISKLKNCENKLAPLIVNSKK